MSTQNLGIFSGSATKNLASRIAQSYGIGLGDSNITPFSDGEFQVCFNDTIRNEYVFIIQSTFAPSDNLVELLLMIDAAKRASAYKIIAVIPYFGFARQDRKDKPRVAIGAKLVSDLLSAAGVSRVITMDLHADQIQGFFNIPVDHLYASSIFIPYIQNMNLPNLTIASPDTGGSKRAGSYAKFLNTDLVVCYKVRTKANYVDKMTLIGEVEGKDVILVDDIIDTAGTITKAADLMIERGATSVRAFCTHGILSGKAYDNIMNSKITEVVVTDSIPTKQCEKITVLSTADLFANVINRVYKGESISSYFSFATQI